MTNYKCEDLSLCENFQAAICLHCNHRLCVQHIIEHDQILFGDVQKLSDLTNITIQQIKDKSNKSRIIYNDVLSSFGEWRTQQLEKLEQIYENELLLIKNEEKILEELHEDLLEALEVYARQPLESAQRRQDINTEILNKIRQTIEYIPEGCLELKWEHSVPSSDNKEFYPSDFPPLSIEIHDKHEQNITSSSLDLSNKLTQIQPTTDKNASSKSSSTAPKIKPMKLEDGHPSKRLIEIFSNISSRRRNRADLASYKGEKNVIILVNSYLTAWNQQSNVRDKHQLLNKHIRTIQAYMRNRNSVYDILVGIQAFFYNNPLQGQASDMMTFLLQFFLYHQCITPDIILDWYNNNDAHGYMGLQKARQLIQPFIQSCE